MNVVVAGGMGRHAQSIFMEQSIAITTGAPVDELESLVNAYLSGALVTDENRCDH